MSDPHSIGKMVVQVTVEELLRAVDDYLRFVVVSHTGGLEGIQCKERNIPTRCPEHLPLAVRKVLDGQFEMIHQELGGEIKQLKAQVDGLIGTKLRQQDVVVEKLEGLRERSEAVENMNALRRRLEEAKETTGSSIPFLGYKWEFGAPTRTLHAFPVEEGDDGRQFSASACGRTFNTSEIFSQRKGDPICPDCRRILKERADRGEGEEPTVEALWRGSLIRKVLPPRPVTSLETPDFWVSFDWSDVKHAIPHGVSVEEAASTLCGRAVHPGDVNFSEDDGHGHYCSDCLRILGEHKEEDSDDCRKG